MSSQQILEKAVQKAIDGGWAPHNKPRRWDAREIMHWYKFGEFSSRQADDDNWKKFIFNHDFAKALWGEGKVEYTITCTCHNNSNEQNYNLWQHHLQNMVVAEDPIKYLGDNLRPLTGWR